MAQNSNNEKKPRNPWMIIGWVIVAFMVLWLGSCVLFFGAVGSAMNSKNDNQESSSGGEGIEETESHPEVKVIAFECGTTDSGQYVKAKLTLHNTSNQNLSFSKAMFEFLDKDMKVLGVEEQYFSTLPAGSKGTAERMFNRPNGVEKCTYSVQDRRGRGIRLDESAIK